MRQVGSLDNAKRASLFTDYLLTQGILAHIEEDSENEWSVWVRDEDQLELAKEELKEFQLDPTSSIYASSRAQAEDIRKEAVRRHDERRKNMVQVRDKWQKGGARNAPLTFVLIAISVGVTLVTGFGDPPSGAIFDALLFNKDAFKVRVFNNGDTEPVVAEGPAVFDNILQGQVWRLVTPIFLHFSLMHLVFNMYWTYVFGSQLESRYSSWWLLWLVLLFAVTSNIAQAYFGGANGGGFSGVGYGLFGYVWMKAQFDSNSNLYMPQTTVLVFIAWFFLCMTGFFGPVGDIAHGTGLLVGVIAGYLPTLLEGQRRG